MIYRFLTWVDEVVYVVGAAFLTALLLAVLITPIVALTLVLS